MKKSIAAVTGSSRGIGRAVAVKLLEEGYHVLLSATSENNELLKSLNEQGFMDCDYIKCDISDHKDRSAFFEFIRGKYGKLDVLVNNAGVAPKAREDLLEMNEESMDRLLDINLKGTFFMCQQAAKLMIETKNTETNENKLAPRIINISSFSAYTSSVSRGEYCISKAGVSMTTRLFADRLAREEVFVFEIRPGIIMTDMISTVKDKYQSMIDDGLLPISRFGLPEDVANAVYAACTGLMDYTSGQVINADGGFHLRRL